MITLEREQVEFTDASYCTRATTLFIPVAVLSFVSSFIQDRQVQDREAKDKEENNDRRHVSLFGKVGWQQHENSFVVNTCKQSCRGQQH